MKVIFVVGPTASGKSDLALKWAEKHNGAIINCDSIQVFKSLNIGSAKPSEQDFSKVPHFLFDYVEEGKETTAGEYQRDFFACLEQIKDRFPVVFVVGGTGFYFQAIEKGMYSIGAADPVVQKQVEQKLAEPGGAEELHAELKIKDPATAGKISINDHYRLGRAIEIIRVHGKSPSEIKKEFEDSRSPFPYPLLKVGIRISKEDLLPRVELRTDKMIEAGLVEEVHQLLQKGLSDWAPLQSVGYKECVEFLKGEIADERALREMIVQNTMRLAKKQRTWFQRDSDIFWIGPGQSELAEGRIETFLENS